MKINTTNKDWKNSIVYLIALLIIVSSFLLINSFVKYLKANEENQMRIWSEAIELTSTETSAQVNNFLVTILQNNKNIPVLLTDDNQSILYSLNINDNVLKSPKKIKEFIENSLVIENKFLGGKNYLYYQNSRVITNLQYYPILIIIVIITLGAITLTYYRTVKKSQQNFVWAGLAKETAHQIGTPLSSLMGWIELLKLEDTSKETISEMEIDIKRLETISNRFSQIGSTPKLKRTNIISETKKAFEYLENRFNNQTKFYFSSNQDTFYTDLNKTLFAWVIENCVKNGIDVIPQRNGEIKVDCKCNLKTIDIYISDNGKGISRANQIKVFDPGFTTKKRGWGLGLSLVKRIIESYHKGKIIIFKSELEKGTTFKITLKKSND